MGGLEVDKALTSTHLCADDVAMVGISRYARLVHWPLSKLDFGRNRLCLYQSVCTVSST
jgi:hypothetical protein